MARGHHAALPQELAHRWKDFLSDEAIDYLAGQTIGSNIPHNDPNSPHKWNAAHQTYNPAVERELRSFMSSKGISQDNPMTVRQAAEFEARILQSNKPEIRDFNQSIGRYSNEVARTRGAGRGTTGAKGGGPND
jgi:hypothetical protein